VFIKEVGPASVEVYQTSADNLFLATRINKAHFDVGDKTFRKKEIKMRKVIALATICAFCAVEGVSGADWSTRFQYEQPGNKFNSNELLLDLFGIHASRDRDNFRGGGTFGLGVGTTYFFTEHFGVGAETYLDEVHWPRHVDANFFARYPIEQLSLAPYGVAGVGRQFSGVSQWTTHIGAGVDFRLNRQTGLFTDVRHVFADESRDLTLWRFGVRMKF
jgi:hypothetical protein